MKGVSHVGKRGCGEEVGLLQFFSTPFFRRGGGTLQGAGHSPRAQELGKVGALGPASPACSASGFLAHRTRQLRNRPIAGSWISVPPRHPTSLPRLPLDWKPR